MYCTSNDVSNRSLRFLANKKACALISTGCTRTSFEVRSVSGHPGQTFQNLYLEFNSELHDGGHMGIYHWIPVEFRRKLSITEVQNLAGGLDQIRGLELSSASTLTMLQGSDNASVHCGVIPLVAIGVLTML
jgi:hypothetical protein